MTNEEIKKNLIEDISKIVKEIGDEKTILEYLSINELDDVLFHLKRDYAIQ